MCCLEISSTHSLTKYPIIIMSMSRNMKIGPRCMAPLLVLLLFLLLGGCGVFAAAHTTAHYFERNAGLPLKGRLRAEGRGWPACDPQAQQWSGYFDIPGKIAPKHYFYWAFGPRRERTEENRDRYKNDTDVVDRAPVVLWMTGGPGCSSTLALLSELGPCLMDSATGGLVHNPWGWNNAAYVVFVDQPAGVGFSYAESGEAEDSAHNEDEVAEDMYHFLQAFYDAHPALRARELFVVGESYGGHYAPATAHRIWRENHELRKKKKKKKKTETDEDGRIINLRGLAVGNGLTDALVQYPYYPIMAYEYCYQKLGHPCVSEEQYAKMLSYVPHCQYLMRNCRRDHERSKSKGKKRKGEGEEETEDKDCAAAALVCNAMAEEYSTTGLNPYDIRQNCSVPGLCYDFTNMTLFLNRADVQEALRGPDAPPLVWDTCNMDVYSRFTNDWFQNFNSTISDLLDDNYKGIAEKDKRRDIRVMIYAGDADYICNWIGNKRWVSDLRWSGATAFANSYDVPFYLDQEPYYYDRPADATDDARLGTAGGLVRAVRNQHSPIHLSFVQVFDAGHMVPMDQPAAASTLLHHFIFNKDFRLSDDAK